MQSLITYSPRKTCFIVLISVWIGGCAGAANSPALQSGQNGPGVPAFWVRPGYKVTLAADKIDNCRFLEQGANGWLYVSRPQKGDILSLKDSDGDGIYETRKTYLSGKSLVHGMHFVDGWLWVAQSRAVYKTKDSNSDGVSDQITAVLPEGSLPGGSGHWWRPVLVSGNHIYTSVGDSGNATDELKSDRQKIWRYNLDGKGKTLFCSGIRNTEKLRIRPGTSEIWGCDHGSDNYGAKLGERSGSLQPVTDLNPPCEFNHYISGGFYGHPFIVGNKLPRLEYGKRPDILQLAQKTISPAWSLGAHWAPNGWCFLTTDKLGAHHKGDAFIACHGSWNSVKNVGYRVQRIMFDDVTGQPYGSLAIVQTLDSNGQPLARPVDCVEAPDGSVLWSCDATGKIYRISST